MVVDQDDIIRLINFNARFHLLQGLFSPGTEADGYLAGIEVVIKNHAVCCIIVYDQNTLPIKFQTWIGEI